MKSRTIAFALVLALSTVALAKGEYIGGSGPVVKGWVPKTYESVKDSFQPMVVYVYDHTVKVNGMAKFFESKECLDHADMKAKLDKFLKIKIKSDGSDAKDWPVNMEDAKGGALLLLLSSDHKLSVAFDKRTDGGTKGRSAAEVMLAMDKILAYEAKLKADKAQHEKREEALAAKAEKEKPPEEVVKPIVGLGTEPKSAKPEVKPDPKRAVTSKPEPAAEDKKAMAGKAEEKPAEDLKVAAEKRLDAAKKAAAFAAQKLAVAQRTVAAAQEEEKKAEAALAAVVEAEKKAGVAKADDKKPGDAAKADASKDPKKKAEDE